MSLIASGLDIVAMLALGLATAVAALLALRVTVGWLGANPFGWVAYNLTRLTEPLVRPLRQPFSGRYSRFDLIPLVAGVLVMMNGIFVMAVLQQLARILRALDGNVQHGRFTTRVVVSESIELLGLLYVVAIFLRFFLPYFGIGYSNKATQFLYIITEPLLKRLRRPLRRVFGTTPFDFTALVAVFLVWVVAGLLADLAWQLM